MTLYETIDLLKKIALKHPNIGSASEGNIYEYMNANPSIKYGVFFITQGTHSQDEMFNHFEFTLFYVDRLVDDMDENRLQIQSIGKEMLSNILTFFCEEFDAECENISFQPFTQRFVDETAGIYSTITIDVPKDVICPEEYWNEDWKAPVTVIRNQDKRVVFTENGTYTIDYDPQTFTGLGTVEVDVNIDVDSYYNNGYEQGQADATANARVLNVTENGTYLSKFSDPIIPTLITGVYDDGTEFYSYTELNGAVYNTKIAGSIDSRLEFWYKGDNTVSGDAFNLIIGSGDNDNSDCFQVRYFITINNNLMVEVGNSSIQVNDWDDTVWHHLIISKAEGLWIDGEKKGDFSPSNTINGEFFINGIGYDSNHIRTANGTFGMIKIDDVVIIPTADGFLNVNTGELLEVVQDGGYNFTENIIKYGEGELFKTINVDVPPKVNIAKSNIKFGYSTFTEVPEWADFDGITDFSNMFYYCSKLTTIPEIDTSNVTDMSYMFYYCSNLQTIPQIDTSNVTTMYRMFQNCGNLTALPEFDVSKVTDINNYFRLSGGNLTDVGGWKNLKIDWNDNYGLKNCPYLTYQSCINILNGLYDFVGNGESTTRTLKVHQNFLDMVGDEISIATNKGWTIMA